MSQQQGITVSDALSMFLLDCEARQFTYHTLRFYKQRLGQFVAWCDDEGRVPSLAALTSSHLRHFLVDTQRRGVSSAYLHSHARAVRAFLNYCVRDELLAVSPFKRVQMPRLEKKILPALTSAQVQRVLAVCETARDQAVVLVLLDSGLRATELCGLDVGDVDMATGAIHVRQGKGQKERVTYIGLRTRKQVQRYLRLERQGDSNALFVSQRGHRLTYSGFAQSLQRLHDASKVPYCNAHALRRTFAINCLRGGMNIYVLAKLMGHADILVLRHYLALVEDDLQAAHGQARVLERLLDGEKRKHSPP